MQPTVQPGDTILALNQMSNATFHCTCNECITPPYWSLENAGRHLFTDNDNDRLILVQRGITYSSGATSAVISIPDTVENNNTIILCDAFITGSTEFSNPPVRVTIIGESDQNIKYLQDHNPLLMTFRTPSTSCTNSTDK